MPRNLEHEIYKEVEQFRQHQKVQRSKRAALILLITIVVGLLYWTRDPLPVPAPTRSTASTPEPSAIALPPSGTITPAQGDSSGQLRLFLSSPIAADQSKLKDDCPTNALMEK